MFASVSFLLVDQDGRCYRDERWVSARFDYDLSEWMALRGLVCDYFFWAGENEGEEIGAGLGAVILNTDE